MIYAFLAVLLGIFSLGLSFFSSGAETGFYRVPRIQLKLDALQGNSTSKALLWLTNHPSVFVATVLVSNNIANYFLSMSGVLFLQSLFGVSQTVIVEILLTFCLSPILFVYGEMFPKFLFLNAPKRLLYRISPLLFFFVVLFLPITIVLWLINRVLSRILNHSYETTRLSLVRSELAKTLDEGHEMGVLGKTQRLLAENVFSTSHEKIRNYAIPLNQFPFITDDTATDTILSLGRVLKLNELPIFDKTHAMRGLLAARHQIEPLGYVRMVDLELSLRKARMEGTRPQELPLREFVEISGNYSFLTALNLFQTARESFGVILDAQRKCIGVISSEQIQKHLLSG